MVHFLSSNPEVLLQMMEDMDSDFSDDELDGFIDDNDKQDDICFFDKQETNSFRKVMSCNRFLFFLKFLHLSDNDKYISYAPGRHDRLHKILPIITHHIGQFKSSYTPNENCSID